jgi:small-conductance mechanosensitive channel
MKEKLIVVFNEFWEGIIAMAPNILIAIFVLLIFFLAGHFLHKFLQKRFLSKWQVTIVTRFAANSAKWFLYLIGLIIALDILNLGGILSSILAGAGITAIIFGFAFKDIGENFLAGLLLVANRPFKVGHIIEIDHHKGVVKGMDLRTTQIRNVEGKDIFIPNAMVVKNVVINYTLDGLLRLEFMVGLDVPSDLTKAIQLIKDCLEKQPEILKNPQANVIVTEIAEFTVNLKVLFWVDILKSKKVSPSYLGITIRSRVIQEVKDLLLRNGFNLPSQILEHKNYQDPFEFRQI